MPDIPELTSGQFRALRIAAAHSRRTPRAERVENDPHGRQYVDELMQLGMLRRETSDRGVESIEVTPLAADLLAAWWRGEWNVSAGNRL